MNSEHVKHIVDVAAALTTVGVVANVLPLVAAVLSIVWTGMRIYEMVTGKQFHLLFTKAAP